MKLARNLGKDIDVSDWFHSVQGSMAIPISSELMECLDKFNEVQNHATEDFASLLNMLREGQRSCTRRPRHLTVHVDGAFKLANVERPNGLICP